MSPKATESGTVAHSMLNRLHQWGIERIYGYPGDGITGFIGGFHEVGAAATRTRSTSSSSRSRAS